MLFLACLIWLVYPISMQPLADWYYSCPTTTCTIRVKGSSVNKYDNTGDLIGTSPTSASDINRFKSSTTTTNVALASISGTKVCAGDICYCEFSYDGTAIGGNSPGTVAVTCDEYTTYAWISASNQWDILTCDGTAVYTSNKLSVHSDTACGSNECIPEGTVKSTCQKLTTDLPDQCCNQTSSCITTAMCVSTEGTTSPVFSAKCRSAGTYVSVMVYDYVSMVATVTVLVAAPPTTGINLYVAVQKGPPKIMESLKCSPLMSCKYDSKEGPVGCTVLYPVMNNNANALLGNCQNLTHSFATDKKALVDVYDSTTVCAAAATHNNFTYGDLEYLNNTAAGSCAPFTGNWPIKTGLLVTPGRCWTVGYTVYRYYGSKVPVKVAIQGRYNVSIGTVTDLLPRVEIINCTCFPALVYGSTCYVSLVTADRVQILLRSTSESYSDAYLAGDQGFYYVGLAYSSCPKKATFDVYLANGKKLGSLTSDVDSSGLAYIPPYDLSTGSAVLQDLYIQNAGVLYNIQKYYVWLYLILPAIFSTVMLVVLLCCCCKHCGLCKCCDRKRKHE